LQTRHMRAHTGRRPTGAVADEEPDTHD
jgi:hypothetical protein